MDALQADRFRPEARVIRLPEWRSAPGEKPVVRFERRGEWRPVHPVLIAALEALRDGATFAQAVAHADKVRGEFKPNHVPILLRRWFWDLRKEGCIDIPLEPPPGLFDGRYRRIEEIGRGNIGVVHLCRDERTGRIVVVKHAWGYISPIDRSEAAIRDEDAALRAFDHDGIPRHLGSFERDGLHHIVREYVEGEPVAAIVAREGPPAPARRLRILRDAVELVRHMHARGYLFLDPTPGNFIARADGSLSVIDVGICRPQVDGRAVGQPRVGSRGYTSPEIVDRGEVGVWSDVFSLACLHFFLATGRAPGHRSSDDERREEVAKLDLPAAEREMLLGAWAHDVRSRWTLDQVFEAIRSAERSA